MKKKRIVRMLTMASVMMLLVVFLAVPAYATGGNVSGAIEGTWSAAQGQIKDIVNNVGVSGDRHDPGGSAVR